MKFCFGTDYSCGTTIAPFIKELLPLQYTYNFAVIRESATINAYRFKFNVYVVLFYVFLTTVVNFFGHAGFRLEKFALGRHRAFSWVALSAFHNRHHQSFTCNYALYFRIWDRVFGTEFK